MDIKRFPIVLIGVLIIFSSTISIASNNFNTVPKRRNDEGNLHTSSTDNIIIDKVFNFTIGDPKHTFHNNIFFEKPYYYEFIMAVVTPHRCDMNITLLDPEIGLYEITYETNMTQDDYRTIPFGTALTGNYTVIFTANLTRNLNVHIILKQGFKCLYDIIPPAEQQKIDFYDVQKFKKGGETLFFNTTFKSDWYYKFYFQRVSPISKMRSSFVVMDHDILSSNSIPYIIFRDESLGIAIYRFGTAVEGLYTMNITIQCVVPCVNIAFAVVERYRIADEINPNNPELPPVEPTNSNQSGIVVSIPPEFMVGTIGFFGCVVGIPILIIVVRKRKNSM